MPDDHAPKTLRAAEAVVDATMYVDERTPTPPRWMGRFLTALSYPLLVTAIAQGLTLVGPLEGPWQDLAMMGLIGFAIGMEVA